MENNNYSKVKDNIVKNKKKIKFRIDSKNVVNVLDRTTVHMYINPHFIYINNLISPEYYDKIYEKISKECQHSTMEMYGKKYKTKKRSLSLLDIESVEKKLNAATSKLNESIGIVINNKNIRNMNDYEEIMYLKKSIEKMFGYKYDYCLVNIYDDGNNYIPYHSDKDIGNKNIFSISLGATRKFRLRKKSKTKGFDYEFQMESGDAILMLGPNSNNNMQGCQQVYKHSVPKERKVKKSRINLTFR